MPPGDSPDPSDAVPNGLVPPGTTELGIDIIKVDRIRDTLAKFGARFSGRVLTPAEQRYVRDRPETFAGRWAAKEAVSKVLGLGVRGIGWRDIEVERLPTGQPAVRLHGRAAARAEQLGMGRIALSITHESDYAVAIAFGVRTSGGRYVFPPDIEDRLDERERRILARIERLRSTGRCRRGGEPGVGRPGSGRGRSWLSAARWGSVDEGTGRPTTVSAPAKKPVPRGAERLDDDAAGLLLPERPKRGHKGSFGKLLVVAGSLDYAGAALLVCRAAGRAGAGLVTLAVPESLQPLFAAKVVEATTMALPEDDVEEIDPEPALARILDHEHDAIVVGPGLRPGLATAELVRRLIAAEGGDPAPIVLDAEALRSIATMDGWWEGERRPAVLTPHAGEFARLRAGSGQDPEADGDLTDDDAARVAAVRDAATTWREVVVLKGAATVIGAPDGSVSIAPFENPALASGGTGDVLAGAIGGLLAQGLEPYAAARLGVYLHGLAGDGVRERFGDAGLLASDLPEGLAIARKRLAATAERRKARGRLGFGLRDADGGAAAESPSDQAVTDRLEPIEGAHRGTPCECRSAAAAAHGLAGDRSRCPGVEPGRPARSRRRRRPHPRGREGRRVWARPGADGTRPRRCRCRRILRGDPR